MENNREWIKRAYLVIVLLLLICILILIGLGFFKVKDWNSILKILPSLITSIIAVTTSYLGFSMIVVQLIKTDKEKIDIYEKEEKLKISRMRPMWYSKRDNKNQSELPTYEFMSYSEKEIFVRDVKVWRVLFLSKEQIEQEIKKVEMYIKYLDSWRESLELKYFLPDMSEEEVKRVIYCCDVYIPPRIKRVMEIKNQLFEGLCDNEEICIPIQVSNLGTIKETSQITSEECSKYSLNIKDNYELISNLCMRGREETIIESTTDYNESVFSFIDEYKNIFVNLVSETKIIYPETILIEKELQLKFSKAVDAIKKISSKNCGTLAEDWDLYINVKKFINKMDESRIK